MIHIPSHLRVGVILPDERDAARAEGQRVAASMSRATMMVATFPSPSASGMPDDIDFGGLLREGQPNDAVAHRADG
eukprot:5440060-Heterocapsa_arctica.AAC.1